MRVNRSVAAGLTCVAVVAVVGGAVYIVVAALIDTGDQIVASLKEAAQELADHFGAAGTSLDDLASNAKDLLAKFGGTAASERDQRGQRRRRDASPWPCWRCCSSSSSCGTPTGRRPGPRDSPRAAAATRSRPWPAGPSRPSRASCAAPPFIALIDAVCITVGLLVLRVPGAVGLGALVFVGAYIPYLGAFISGAVAVLVALADRGFVIALWALGVVLAVQVLEGHVLQPMIQSRTVQMHPAVVMVAITAGASVAGILGMLLAVPLTAAAFGVVHELRDALRAGTRPGRRR